jgi:UDP-2,3-diacylglucosamine pyrophosphatase LpxH
VAEAPDAGSLDLVFVSDVQLSPRDTDTTTSDALASFIRLLPDEQHPVRLVLLGDIFELSPPECGGADPGRAATADLVSLTEIHHGFFRTLRAFLADRRCSIEVVTGNHDVSFLVGDTWDALVRRLAAADMRAAPHLMLRPWYLHIPGIVHSQHGHQLHDLNSHPCLLEPCFAPVAEGLGLPLGVHLDRIMGRDGSGASHRVAAFAAALHWSTSHLSAEHVADIRDRYRRDVLVVHHREPRAPHQDPSAAALGAVPGRAADVLPVEVALVLDRWSDVTTAGVLRGVARRRLLRRDYMRPAIDRLGRLLEDSGTGVPVVVTGHTHRPGLADANHGRGIHAGCGTWQRFPQGDSGTAVRITVRSGRVGEVELLRYDERTDRIATLDSRRPLEQTDI